MSAQQLEYERTTAGVQSHSRWCASAQQVVCDCIGHIRRGNVAMFSGFFTYISEAVEEASFAEGYQERVSQDHGDDSY